MRTIFETSVDYGPAEDGVLGELGCMCTVFTEDGDEEVAYRFPLCTPLDCLLADAQDEDGFVEEEHRPLFEAMKLDLRLMLERIERVKYR